MIIILMNKNLNGSYMNQSWNENEAIPDGYAIFPEEYITENFPFGNAEFGINEKREKVVTNWIDGKVLYEEIKIE